MANETVFKRYKGNPIITAEAVPRANSIHNSAIVPFEKGYAGIFRVDEIDFNFTMHVGFSSDGIKWDIEPDVLKLECTDPELEIKDRTYDPRLTKIDDVFYFTWCIDSARGPMIGMATTTDFKTFQQKENLTLPANRNCVIFPRKISGEFAMYSRPSDMGHTPFGAMWYSTSPDMTYWGHHRFVFAPTRSSWQSTKIGPGPAPIEIDEGWLLIYHGVWTSCNGYLYYAGGAILDRDEPWKVLYRTKDYLIAPTEIYERLGDVPNVVFPSSAVILGNKMRLYYGCADTCISMAEAEIPELIDFIKTHSM